MDAKIGKFIERQEKLLMDEFTLSKANI